jgi:D-alanine-D-alanine ligase
MPIKVAVLAGGISPEREVSLRSGQACEKALSNLGNNCKLIDFRGAEQISELLEFAPDIAFLVTHGDFGEDGRLQGLLDWLKIRYTGSSAAVSALCMDKYLSKQMFQKAGLPTAESCLNQSDSKLLDLRRTLNSERLFIKTKCGGSSIGAKELTSQKQLQAVAEQPGQWIIEPLLVGREITLGFLQRNSEWQTLPILELKAKNDFYDYEAKYTEGMTEFICPAPMSDAKKDELVAIGKSALECCGVSGYARVDMILNDEEVHILEINTLPGMTNTSDLPAMAKTAGIDFEELVDIMVSEALINSHH